MLLGSACKRRKMMDRARLAVNIITCYALLCVIVYYCKLLLHAINKCDTVCYYTIYYYIVLCAYIYIYTYYHYIIKERGRNIPLLGVDLLVAVLVEEGEYFSELLDLLLYYYYYYYY